MRDPVMARIDQLIKEMQAESLSQSDAGMDVEADWRDRAETAERLIEQIRSLVESCLQVGLGHEFALGVIRSILPPKAKE